MQGEPFRLPYRAVHIGCVQIAHVEIEGANVRTTPDYQPGLFMGSADILAAKGYVLVVNVAIEPPLDRAQPARQVRYRGENEPAGSRKLRNRLDNRNGLGEVFDHTG